MNERVKQGVARAQRFNKATAAAIVTLLAFALSQLGFDLPAEVQGALITLAVFVVPNR